jgi:tetratricopeptide (TPR) repeat protein
MASHGLLSLTPSPAHALDPLAEKRSGARARARVRIRVRMAVAILLSLGGLFGCDRMVTPRQTQLSNEAETKAREGDYTQAINLYEAALDGSAKSAEVHYQLALIYDDKMNDPLSALHHFKRFLALDPTNKRAQEVKTFMKRDELTLQTNLTGDSMVPRSELVRLNNENLNLRKQIGEDWAKKKAANAGLKSTVTPGKDLPNEKSTEHGKARRHTVQPGETLASISRKYYKSKTHWQKILDANTDIISKPSDLKPGQILTIP